VRDADAPILVEVDRDQAREQADGLGDDELDEDQSDEGDERMRGQRLRIQESCWAYRLSPPPDLSGYLSDQAT